MNQLRSASVEPRIFLMALIGAFSGLALLLAGSGVLHFVTPRPYESIVPRALGNPKPWVRVSGVGVRMES